MIIQMNAITTLNSAFFFGGGSTRSSSSKPWSILVIVDDRCSIDGISSTYAEFNINVSLNGTIKLTLGAQDSMGQQQFDQFPYQQHRMELVLPW